MPFEIIVPPVAPPPLAPYCAATRAGDTIYVSGILPIGLQGETIGVGDIRVQTRYVLETIRTILSAGGAGLRDIAMNQIFLKDMDDYAGMNEIYRDFFPDRPPARYCVRSDLVKPDFLVEIVATAYVGAPTRA